MHKTLAYFINFRLLFAAILTVSVSGSIGCTLKQIRKQTNVIENTGVIKGEVKVVSPQKGPVVILPLQENNGTLTLTQGYIASSAGYFKIAVSPGSYLIAAFIDTNNDGQYQPDENGNFYQDPLVVNVNKGQEVELKPLYIEGSSPELLPDLEVNIFPIFNNIGTVTSLDDPMFDAKNYSTGMWKPLDFLNQVGGGLFFLQEYDKNKIPVLFVHGAKGGPENWRDVIDCLDKRYFQPWVLYYPSGLKLEMISDYLVHAVIQLQNQYDFKNIYIIAHSMGGLVTRSFVKKYTEKFPDFSNHIKLVMTISSPMAGMASAARSVKYSPVVLPAWRDVASDSSFIRNINAWEWPEYIPYYLVFSYITGDSSDGVAALESQIPLDLQSESRRIYGFNNKHMDVLSDKKFLGLFKKIIENSRNW